jgi:uncharacterized delta-60 repeat protein
MKFFCSFLLFSFYASIAMSQIQSIHFLDTTFGKGGRFSYHFNSGDLYFHNTVVARQLDGKIIAGSRIRMPSGIVAQGLVQCLEDGTVDSSFANNGEWFTDDPWFSNNNKLMVQPDGKIVLAGRSGNEATLLHLLSDGSYDITFGNNGKIKHAVFGLPNSIAMDDIGMLSDGKLIFAASYGPKEIAIVCLNADGSLCPEFGTMSKVFFPREELGYQSIGSGGIAVTEDNKILVTGSVASLVNYWEAGFIRRYDSTGKIDSTFGQNGTTMFEAKLVVAGDILLFPDGGFIIPTKVATNLGDKLAHVKFNANGTIDTNYGVNGYAIYNENSAIKAAFLQPDEKVIVTTYLPASGVDSEKHTAIRFNQNGAQDVTFGNNGEIYCTKYIGGDSNYVGLNFSTGFALSNEKFIVSGRAFWGDTLVIARYMTGQSVGVVDIPSTIQSALLYPNPVYTPSVTLEYELTENSQIDIDLINAEGKWMASLLSEPRTSGNNKEEILLPAGLSPGFYYLNIRNNRGNTFVKLVVISA